MLRNGTDPHELLHLWSSQEEPDTKLIVHSHEILKESSSKVSIHFSSGDTNVFLVNLTHLYEYGKRIYIMDSHGQYKKNIRLSVLSSKMKLLSLSLDFMHLLGTIILVHLIEKERQHALKYSRAVPNSKARW